MEYRAAQTAAVISTFAIVGTLFVFLRLWTRFVIIRAAGWEDWVLIASWLNAIVTVVCIGMQVYYGLGSHGNTLSPYQNERISLNIYISISTYCASIGLTKLAILMQYRRVFQTPRFQLVNWIFIAIIIGYTISTVVACIFVCWPVQRFWKPAIEGHCINTFASWFANAILNIITDLMIIALPMPVVRSLQLKPRQKILLMGVFAFGVVVCIVSILRLHSLQVITHSTDPSYDNAPVAAFSIVETYVALICACLPTLRPLLSQWFSGLGSSAHASSNPYDTYGTGGAGSLHVDEILSSSARRSRRRSSLPFASAAKGLALQGLAGAGKRGAERLGDGGWEVREGDGRGAREERDRSRDGTIVVETRVDVRVTGEGRGGGKGKTAGSGQEVVSERESSTDSLFRDTKYIV